MLILLLLPVFGLFIWWWYHLDCDLETYIALKFGRSIDTLQGKTIWITGASSGIGEGLAYVLASVGCKLVLSATNESKLQDVAKRCVSIGKYDSKNVLVLPFNITDSECHQKMLDKVLQHFNKLDILINNAGRSQRASFIQIEPEVDKQLFDINVFGLVNLTRVVLRYFFEQNIDGQFGVTSSTAGLLGVPFSASYTGSKHALHGYFECLRTELGRRTISITMFCVGPVFSNLLEKAFTGETGKVVGGKQPVQSSRKLSSERCGYLMAVALANRIDQSWISLQPVLTIHYLAVYFPQIFRKVFPFFFNEKRSQEFRDG
ncbi:dehydrogenase/reductase SDR family member 7 [Dermatophagoides farinae]|nr:dehydrogenase/reductase SDR family member 7-like [Dermatophagoides farinae]KAH7638414.1 dehydrogenase/reductase sdr family member 7-like protein [Dermatophagoides farinae]